MRRLTYLVVLTLSFALASFATAVDAQAGSYTVRQCLGALQQDFGASFSPTTSENPHVNVVAGCYLSGSGKTGLYQDRGGTNLNPGEGGQFTWSTPPGVAVAATAMTARVKDANGIRARLVGFDGNTTRNLDQGVAHDGESRTSHWSGPSYPQTTIIARLFCSRPTFCPNKATSPKAFLEITDAEFTARDTSRPWMTVSGPFWDWANDSQFHHGTASLEVGASDQGAGIAAAWVEVNGLRVDLAKPLCSGDRGAYASRFNPCPDSFSQNRTFDVSQPPFREGPNQVRVCVADYADAPSDANRNCSWPRTMLVDNEKPAPPANLRVLGGGGWRPTNDFELRWDVPSGQTAPIVGAIWALRDPVSGDQVDSGYLEGTDLSSGGYVEAPRAGEFEATVILLDAAFNIGQPAKVTLRFDDRPPGDVEPEPASGWVSADELPIKQEVGRAEAGGPSGISGYALTVSEEGPAPPCEDVICLAPEITLNGGADLRTSSVGGLREGAHWISAVAVSGAHRRSLDPGTTMVQVDKTPPESTISGVPETWVNHPVTVVVHATDALSGMAAAPARDNGQPSTYVDAEGYATYATPGDTATFSVATEGVSTIRYWARDLAGNANDGEAGRDGEVHPKSGRAIVRIDAEPPDATFDRARNPADPELIRLDAIDLDSGVSSAEIQIRRAGAPGEFVTLPTYGEGGRFTARVPSDDLSRGSYEIRAKVTDRAGNEATVDRAADRHPMILNLPVKKQGSLTAMLGKGRTARAASYGKKVFIHGRLTSRGTPLTNQPLEIVEQLAIGSRRKNRVTRVRTDGDGRYRTGLLKGPSRKIQVIYAGTRQVSRMVSPKLSLAVRGRIHFRLRSRRLRNGGSVRMSGSVGFRGALPPARGKLVAIQFFDPSRRNWRPVEVLRTNRRGRFRYRYRFRTISSAQRIIFRAAALPEAGWPYRPSTSRPRSVIVYPKGTTSR